MPSERPPTAAGLRILITNWRDTTNPEGGGAERYVESLATSLARAGHVVTLFCAAHANGAPDETREGVRILRRGGKLTVYPRGLLSLLLGRLGRPDVIIDVQNGIPFFARAVARCPVLVLVHHVHREQWPVVYGRTAARLGWWVESRLSPRIHRGCQYVAVSEVTRRELVALGVRERDIAVVHNGTDPPLMERRPAPQPRILVVTRLVPHKRVEHVLRAVAVLRREEPNLRVRIVGDGWWAPRLRELAAVLQVDDVVDFAGHVDEHSKHQDLAAAWVLAVPSLKEGWGLTVMEAAAYGVPTVAYADAGGLAESVVDGVTGVLVRGDLDEYVEALRDLIRDAGERQRLGTGARRRAAGYTWARSARSFAVLLQNAVDAGRPLDDTDPKPSPEHPAAAVVPSGAAPSL